MSETKDEGIAVAINTTFEESTIRGTTIAHNQRRNAVIFIK